MPRHIERCDQIKREAESYSLKTHLHSKKQNMKKPMCSKMCHFAWFQAKRTAISKSV